LTRIIKLEMKGFKSFAKQTELLFGEHFNVVLGPNGSGKSNIIDALCFVLGKSSAKGLRAEKSANLIYNGGKSKKGASEGEVSIYFDNSKRTFPLDDQEVKLTRIVKASGQSQYIINKQKVTRAEVIDFLHHARINPDGYNIILQGDIIHFVEMSGESRRKVIEEIADISIYEEKKGQAFSELQKVEDSFKEAEIILKERKNYLSDLSKEKEQAVKFESYEKTVKSGKATLVTRLITDKSAQIVTIQEKNKAHVEKRDKLQIEINELKQIVVVAKDEVREINAEIEKRGDAEQVAMHKEIESIRVTIGTDKNRVDAIKDEMQKLGERKSQLANTLKELNDKAKFLRSEESEKQKQLSFNQKQKQELEHKISEFKKKHNLEGASDVEAEIEELDKKIEVGQKNIDELRVQQQDLLRAKDRLEIQINTSEEKIEKMLSVSKEHKKEVDQLKHKKEEFKKVTVELSQILTRDSALASELGNARGRMHHTQEELAKVSARKASIQETLGGSAVSAIIENKKRLGGIHGTVSSLGSVQPTYAKALEVAAAARLKAIVVEDDSAGQACIDFLKKNKLGVATFLPMNKIRGQALEQSAKELIKKPGVYGFAIDLIKFDSKYRAIFEHVFGSTVVVEDIATARKIGIGSAKMVTLDGDIAERSGAMQGGFRKANTLGGFSQSQVDDEEQKLETEFSDLTSLVSRLEKDKAASEQQISQLREFKANLEGDIIKLQKGLHVDDSDLDMSQKLRKDFEVELVATESKFRDIQQKISTDMRELANLKIAKQKLRDKINDLRNPTKLAELNTFDDQLSKAKEAIIRLETELKHISEQVKNLLGPEEENIRRVMKAQEKEESDFKNQISELLGKTKLNEERLKSLEVAEKEFYDKFKKFFEKRKELTEKIEKAESKTIAKEDEIRDFERRLSVVSVDIAKLQAEINVLKDEVKDYEGVELLPDSEEYSTEKIKRDIYSAEQKLKDIGPVNMKAVAMYDKVQFEYDKLIEKREVLTQEKENVLVMINQIETRKKDLFIKVYDRLNANFKRIFSSLSEKGEAYLELENPDAPFEAGVNVKVRLSGKKFMDIRSLSGGEKTMTALAMIFAIQENDPASFYIMDEVDAALDKRNAEKLAELVNQYCDRAQYIVISHNDGVIGAANTLYGISMDQQTGISKVVSLKL
jgi:chromosome segregation protein